MSERMQAYFEELEKRSSEELDRSVRELAVDEKDTIARCIAHIAEIGKRDYHLELRYRSLYEYCVERLNLSEGSVYRRTQVAGVCRRFPQILESLSSGRLHLTGAGLISPYLTEDNAEYVISEVEGKTKRQIKEFLVTLEPKEEFTPSIRKQPTVEPAMFEESSEVLAAEEAKREGKPASPSNEQRTADLLEPATPERYNFRFSAGKEFTEKFKRLAEVLGIHNPHTNMEDIFDQALEIALDKKDPKRKLERRRKREEKKQATRAAEVACPGEAVRADEGSCAAENPCSDDTTCAGEAEKSDESSARTPVSRYLPSRVQERVLERAGYQCEYSGPDGVRCSSRTGLQVEHVKPFAVFRTHDEEHLRAFCPEHNRFAAKEYFGREFIQRKIDAARSEKEKRSGAHVQTT